MSFEDAEPVRRLRDPLAMRALAHPLRIQLGELLGRDGPMTGAQAGRALGISQALASHHLRQLAKYGFVERVAGDNARDRPWRRVHPSLSWSHDPADAERDDEADSAAEVLDRLWLERAARNLDTWHRRRDAAPPGWEAASGITQNLVYVTPEEAQALRTAIAGLIEPYVARHRLGETTTRPPGSLPFDLTTVAVPLDPTPSGG